MLLLTIGENVFGHYVKFAFLIHNESPEEEATDLDQIPKTLVMTSNFLCARVGHTSPRMQTRYTF